MVINIARDDKKNMINKKIQIFVLITTLVVTSCPWFVNAQQPINKAVSNDETTTFSYNNFDISITKPQGYLYFLDTEIAVLLPVFPLDAIVVGWINVEVNVESGPVDKVEFYVDNELRETDMESPYEWRWNEHSLLPPVHCLKVVGYSGAETAEDMIFLVYINPSILPSP